MGSFPIDTHILDGSVKEGYETGIKDEVKGKQEDIMS